MRGQILGVDRRTGEGQLAGEDGRRYAFRPDDWAHRGEPAVGLQVDFQADQGRALSIFPVPGAVVASTGTGHRNAPTTDRNKYVAAILAFFFGTLGIHRFYLGRTGSGIAMLVLTLAMVCPFEVREKQALLVAATPEERAEMLVSLLRIGAHPEPESGDMSPGRKPS